MEWKDHYWHNVPVTRERINEIVRCVLTTKAKTVLDCGSNEGFLSQALKEAGLEVTSLDTDAVSAGKAKEYFGIDTVMARVESIPYEDETFDCVVGGEIMEHLKNPGRGLEEMFRVSKGPVIISLPIGEYWLGEGTHKWWIDATLIEHDQGIREQVIKKGLVLIFNKRPQEARKEET